MRHRRLVLPLAAVLLGTSALTAQAQRAFDRIAAFAVVDNMPEGADRSRESSAEIIAATADGLTLVYSDSPLGAIGFVDLTDPASPQPGGLVEIDGEPTSVAVAGDVVLVAVNTSESYTEPSGRLDALDIASREIVASCDLGGQPDSIAVAPDGSFVAIAIENERDEDLNDGVIPQLPAGNLTLVGLNAGRPDCASLRVVELTGLAAVAAEDPEPEFVDVNASGEVAVTLQENDHVVIVDGGSGEIVAHWPAGAVDLANVDTEEEGAIAFTGALAAVVREPDAIKWLDEERLLTANEGDYEGGSRGFTIFARDGSVLFDSGMALDYEAARLGHYPEDRSGNKGSEPEGAEVATFGDTPYLFVALERASLIAVYRDTGSAPEFVQMLPSGIGPEGLVAIPGRNLLVTANEADLGEDGAARSHVMVYALQEGQPRYPTIVSADDEDGLPIGWGALSGLVADASEPGRLYAVTDSFYGGRPQILVIDATVEPAVITDRMIVTRDGAPAEKLDLEGIALAEDGGFWLASEGRTDREIPHAILRVDGTGAIVEEIALPEALLANEIRFGFEGVTTTGSGADLTLWLAMQREWQDDPEGLVKLVAYQPASGTWGAVHYPLEAPTGGWVGLSEITAVGDTVYVVERDNLIGSAAANKRIYAVATADLVPTPLGETPKVVSKTLVRDLLPDLAAFGGYVQDKVEGFAVDASGQAFAVTDNDGVDDASGETLFLRLGTL